MSLSTNQDFTNPNHILYNEFAIAKPEKSEAAKLLSVIGIFVMLWAASIATFGVVGLYLPAVALVPFIFVVLIMITWDKDR